MKASGTFSEAGEYNNIRLREWRASNFLWLDFGESVMCGIDGRRILVCELRHPGGHNYWFYIYPPDCNTQRGVIDQIFYFTSYYSFYDERWLLDTQEKVDVANSMDYHGLDLRTGKRYRLMDLSTQMPLEVAMARCIRGAMRKVCGE